MKFLSGKTENGVRDSSMGHTQGLPAASWSHLQSNCLILLSGHYPAIVVVVKLGVVARLYDRRCDVTLLRVTFTRPPGVAVPKFIKLYVPLAY